MEKKDRFIVSTSELAEILGLTDRRIQQLASAGVIPKLERGKFHLPTVIQQYLLFFQEKANESNEEELDLKKERTLLIRAQRRKTELELQIMRGELHRSEDIEKVMNDMLGAFRARCLAIPTKAAPKLLGKTDLSVVQDIIKKEVYEALSELSNYDPEMFYARSKDKDKLVLNPEEDVG